MTIPFLYPAAQFQLHHLNGTYSYLECLEVFYGPKIMSPKAFFNLNKVSDFHVIKKTLKFRCFLYFICRLLYLIAKKSVRQFLIRAFNS